MEFRMRYGRTNSAVTVATGVEAPRHTSTMWMESCDVVVVGAGWGGIYFAWRLAVDSASLAAKDICIYEASGRLGGRVLSVTGLPLLNHTSLTIDFGAYRFRSSHRLPADLIAHLGLGVGPYGEPDDCKKVVDADGNNAGYHARARVRARTS